MLIVDEAFIDLLPRAASLAGNLPANAVVLRSFGKTYGLAGLRLGFAIAPLRFAQHLGKELGPWAVSGPALEIGRVALDDEAWLKAAAKRLATDQEKLDALLLAAGFTILGGTTLFRLGEHPEAMRLVDATGPAGNSRPRFCRPADLAEIWTARERRRIPPPGNGSKPSSRPKLSGDK